MDVRWIKIRSWHAVDFHTRGFDSYKTVCGRGVVSQDVRDDLPRERSCETCLRIVARKTDQ